MQNFNKIGQMEDACEDFTRVYKEKIIYKRRLQNVHSFPKLDQQIPKKRL